MRYQQKAKEIEAFTFPISFYVSDIDIQNTDEDGKPNILYVSAGDYLLFIDGQMSVMTKKEFHAKHDPVELSETRDSKPRTSKTEKQTTSKRGLAKSVLEQQAKPNGAVHKNDDISSLQEQAE